MVTVTMNTSVDISYPPEDFKLEDVNRVQYVQKTAGRKGLNVAWVISQMRESVIATGFLGGTPGDFIIQEQKKGKIPVSFLKINQE